MAKPAEMTTALRRSTMQAMVTIALTAGAFDTAAALDASAADADAAATRAEAANLSAIEPAEPADWSVLDRHAGSAPDRSPLHAHWTMPARRPAAATTWSRTDHANGSTALTVKRPLQVPWDSNIGAEFSLAPLTLGGPGPVDPIKLVTGADDDASAGAAWASLAAPSSGWGNVALGARLDATEALGKASVSASHAMALGRQLSLTLQSGYAAAESFAPPALPPDASGASRFYTTEQVARLTILPTQTKIAAALTMSTTDAHWVPALSAEQSLFEGASVAGSISESAEGLLNTSILARFQRRW